MRSSPLIRPPGGIFCSSSGNGVFCVAVAIPADSGICCGFALSPEIEAPAQIGYAGTRSLRRYYEGGWESTGSRFKLS